MKCLQTRNTPNGKPRVLEMGVDFDFIGNGCLYTAHNFVGERSNLVNFDSIDNGCYMDFVCSIEDCYQSRPLIEINGYCEFDLIERTLKGVYSDNSDDVDTIMITIDNIASFLSRLLVIKMKNLKVIDIKKGSIFISENQIKYPDRYQQALGYVNDLNKPFM